MELSEFQALERGDKIVYDGKPDEIWEVDHPTSTSTKKEFMSKLENMSEPCPGGGGNCPKDNRCIIASLATPIGRGSKRHSQVFSDPAPWTKVV